MKPDFDAALDRCLADLAGGASLEACLARHPEHAGELRPLLELAGDLRQVSTPYASPGAREAGRQQMLAALAARPKRRSGLGLFWQRAMAAVRAPAWRPAGLMVLITLAALAAFLLAASTTSLPGDVLYPVKLASQDVQLAITLDPAKAQILSGQFATARRLDVHTALAQGRTASVHFEGILESMDGDRWRVSSLPVAVPEVTQVHGAPYAGAPVEVDGELTGAGYVRAASIEIEQDHAPWPAPTYTQSPTPAPTVTPTPVLRTATPTATQKPPASPTPRPTVTASATEVVTDTPRATAVPDVTVAVTPSGVPPSVEPSPTAEPTKVVEPPETPRASDTPASSDTPRPTDLPPPSETPRPTDTPRPSKTPRPTATPRPSATPEPTETPKPTETPVPTQTPEPGEDDASSRFACALPSGARRRF